MKKEKGKSSPWLKWLWIIPLAILILCFSIWAIQELLFQRQYGGMPIAAWTSGVAPDCTWYSTAFAWLDVNENGVYDKGEQPLPNITFHIDGNGNFNTNWKGEATLMVWLPGCPEEIFKIYPDVQPGFHLTTDPSVSVGVREFDKVFEFGFSYLPGIPTLTPRPPLPKCISYQIGVENEYDVTDLAAAADGSIWATTYGNGVVHYLPDQDKWVRFTIKDGLVSDHVRSITTVDDGDVWFAADGGASYWDGTRFLSYTTSDGLVGDNVYKVAQAPDHSIWFATDEGASHYIPSTNTWISYTAKDGLAGDFVKYVAITPDGSVWLPTLLDGLSRLILPSGNEAPIWITYSPYVEGDNKISLDFIDQIQVGPDGRYWFAGLGGFMQYDPKTKTWLADNNYSEVGGQINSFTFGPDGSIWIASGSDTPVVYHSSLNGQNVWEIYDSRDGIPTINKPDVNEDRAEAIAVPSADVFWVATFEKATRCVLSK